MNIPARTQASLTGLGDMVKYIDNIISTKESTIYEIGSWVGASAILFSASFGNVICIDPFISIKGTITAGYNMEDVEALFYKNIEPYENITHIKQRSTEFLSDLAKRQTHGVDVIYIDGEHTYEAVKADIQASLKLHPRILCGHDYWPNRFDGVIKAVNETIGRPDKVFKDTSWIKVMG